MSNTEQWDEDKLHAYVELKYEEQADSSWTLIQRWLDRGDGAAVYENHDLGHPNVGMPKITSYGSPDAQIEMDYPPEQMPDGIGNEINWRYQLIATCRRSKA